MWSSAWAQLSKDAGWTWCADSIMTIGSTLSPILMEYASWQMILLNSCRKSQVSLGHQTSRLILSATCRNQRCNISFWIDLPGISPLRCSSATGGRFTKSRREYSANSRPFVGSSRFLRRSLRSAISYQMAEMFTQSGFFGQICTWPLQQRLFCRNVSRSSHNECGSRPHDRFTFDISSISRTFPRKIAPSSHEPSSIPAFNTYCQYHNVSDTSHIRTLGFLHNSCIKGSRQRHWQNYRWQAQAQARDFVRDDSANSFRRRAERPGNNIIKPRKSRRQAGSSSDVHVGGRARSWQGYCFWRHRSCLLCASTH